jgi:hydroxyacylglutathione hydrolase
MFLHSFYTPGLAINSYLVGDMNSKRAVIVDPTLEVDIYINYAQKEKFIITDIIETHVHADFISGAKELKHRLEEKPLIHCSSMGGEEWTPKYADRKVETGYELKLEGVALKAVHTPGHTPEHVIWLAYDQSRSKETPCLAFTGDLLFVGSVGRPDLLGPKAMENLAKQLYHSLFEQIGNLPDFLEIYPAHGAGSLCGKGLSPRATSTLGYERLFNPMLIQKPIESWIELIQCDMPSAPPHYQKIKRMNVEGVSASSIRSPNHQQQNCVIDIRSPELFAQGHFKDALNIPLGLSFCQWAASVLDNKTSLTIVASFPDEISQAINNLRLIGFDQIGQKVLWNDKENQSDRLIETLPTLSVEEMSEIIQNQKSYYLMDVRTEMEWKVGHIEEAHHLELAGLKEKMQLVPKDRPIYVICGSGYRASLAASFLKSQGFKDVFNIQGGMLAWNKGLDYSPYILNKNVN